MRETADLHWQWICSWALRLQSVVRCEIRNMTTEELLWSCVKIFPVKCVNWKECIVVATKQFSRHYMMIYTRIFSRFVCLYYRLYILFVFPVHSFQSSYNHWSRRRLHTIFVLGKACRINTAGNLGENIWMLSLNVRNLGICIHVRQRGVILSVVMYISFAPELGPSYTALLGLRPINLENANTQCSLAISKHVLSLIIMLNLVDQCNYSIEFQIYFS